ncbi:hypothetical protein DOY81_012451, partial [Sarcophaga bullata]
GYLDGSYFCFISLSSIGFGDLVPGDRVITADKDKVEVSFILCAVYLLLGMALIAMCFNLMQEQVIHNIRAFKRAFKACFRLRHYCMPNENCHDEPVMLDEEFVGCCRGRPKYTSEPCVDALLENNTLSSECVINCIYREFEIYDGETINMAS